MAMLLRGCWHRKMSWPVRSQDHSYQVCLGCGIKRLFDESAFRAYGPYSYDFTYLISWDQAQQDDARTAAAHAGTRDAQPAGDVQSIRNDQSMRNDQSRIASIRQEKPLETQPAPIPDISVSQERSAS
jgi:hypothetical protein